MTDTLASPLSRPPRRRCRISPYGTPQQVPDAVDEADVDRYVGNVTSDSWLIFGVMISGQVVEIPLPECEQCGGLPFAVSDPASLARMLVSHRLGAKAAVSSELVALVEEAIAGGGEWAIAAARFDSIIGDAK